MNKIKSIFFPLNISDLIVVIFYIFLTTLNIIFFDRIPQASFLILMNAGVFAFVFSIAYLDYSLPKKFWFYIHYWYLFPLILLTFKEMYLMIKPIRIYDYDHLLIAADRFIFGFDPTDKLFAIANPILTEILQIAYGTFYFLPIILGYDLFKEKKVNALDFSAFAIVYGFLLSYLGYFILPAIGPRFTLHNFENTNLELPGLFLTNFLREIVNIGESIPAGTPNPAEVVQRDVFPSGHTQMTLIVMYLSIKFKTKARWFLIPNGILLIFATVYLRYHYVIDLIGGTLFMIFTMWSGKYLYNWWRKVKNEKLFSYKI